MVTKIAFDTVVELYTAFNSKFLDVALQK